MGTTPSLAQLRRCSGEFWPETAGNRLLRLSHTSCMDVFDLHALEEYHLATFQVASQFNCLEFPSDCVTPEEGVSQCATDGTQGPACALAAAPALVVRNYFLAMPDGSTGQTADNQINCLADFLDHLGATELVDLRNGYAMSDELRLGMLNARLQRSDREEC